MKVCAVCGGKLEQHSLFQLKFCRLRLSCQHTREQLEQELTKP